MLSACRQLSRRRVDLPDDVVPRLRSCPPGQGHRYAIAAEHDRRYLPRRHAHRRIPRGFREDLLAPESAYAGIACWNSREDWLTWTVPIAIGLRPEILASTVAKATFLAWARTESLAADHGTGRRVIIRPDVVADLMGMSVRTVRYCRAAARSLGLLVDVVAGRILKKTETSHAWRRQCPVRRLANESALTIPSWVAHIPRSSGVSVDVCSTTGSPGREPDQLPEVSRIPRGRREQAPPSSAQHRRTRPGGDVGPPDPQKWALRGLTTQLARELTREIAWLRDEQPGRLKPILARFVRGPLPWTVTDVAGYITRQDELRGRYALTPGAIRTRPAAVLAAKLRGVDPQADHPRGDELLEPQSERQVLPATRPQWCGECDPRTRHVELADDRVGRCPTCHPLAKGF